MILSKISIPLVVALLVFSALQAAYAQAEYFETKGVYLYQDDSGSIIIGGEIENVSDTPRGAVEITITLYDQDKKVGGLATSNTHVDTIHPEQVSSFETVLRDQTDISRIRSWNMTISSEKANAKVRNLRLIVDESRIDPRGVYFVEGRATNMGNTTATLSRSRLLSMIKMIRLSLPLLHQQGRKTWSRARQPRFSWLSWAIQTLKIFSQRH